MALTWRLRKHVEYQKAYAQRRKGSTPQISYFFALREGTEPVLDADGVDKRAILGPLGGVTGPRVGLTVPKAVGKAHERNRIKRRLREIVRLEVGRLQGNVDVILHPRRSTLEAEFGGLQREVVEIFGRIKRALAGVEGAGAGGGRSTWRAASGDAPKGRRAEMRRG